MCEPFEIPRCSHGKILLGCKEEDCPEQGEYLKKHNQSVQEFLDLQQANARAFVREYLGLPPETMVPDYVLDAAHERIDSDGS